MDAERISWDSRYRKGSHASLDPDPFLLSAYKDFIEPLFPNGGTALDVAGGVGRHALWLAQRGWQVTLTDISEAGIAKARENAGPLAERIDFQLRDLDDFKASVKYDLLLVFFYLQRTIFPELVRSLRPGGLLVYKTYSKLQANFEGGPTHPMHLLQENELLREFSSLTVLHYHESIRERGVAEIVAINCP
jgi:tellurite methyltransferase